MNNTGQEACNINTILYHTKSIPIFYQKRLNDNQVEGYWDEELSKANLERWEELDEEERHDMEVIRNSRYLQ